MSPKVFHAALAQETNAFAPLPTGLAHFTGRYHACAREVSGPPPFPESLLATLEKKAAAGALQLVIGPIAGAHPSGRVTRHAYECLRDQILAELTNALPLDLVILHLHGAMIADGEVDCEGDLLSRIRVLAGPDVVIGALLDPHAHLSARMVEASDILVAYKLYPHTDFKERANELVDLALRTQSGTVRPCSALWDAGVIGIFHTRLPDARAMVERIQRWERSGDALTVSLIHGFPWGDSPDLGTRALVICDNDAAAADRLAAELAELAQRLALKTATERTAIAAALADLDAQPYTGKPTIWADTADNPGGGAAGDSTYVLAALLREAREGACLGPLWDPGAVDIAFEAGVGARLALRVGGKTGPQSGDPIDVSVEVLALDTNAHQMFADEVFPLGRAAAVRCAGVDVVLVSERDQARGTDLFTNLGVSVTDKQLVVVKSSQHFFASFAPIAQRVVYLDCPGSLQADLSQYPYQFVTRPRWPIDAALPRPARVPLKSTDR